MHRFYLPPEACRGDILTLSGPEGHHAAEVLRLEVGDAATVLDGLGGVYECRVAARERRSVRLNVTQRHSHPLPSSRITLVQSVTKTRSMEWIVQKATELGVQRLLPVLTERSVPQWTDDERVRKSERWREIAIESVKQCGTPWLPRIELPVPFASALATATPPELAWVASLHPGAQHPRVSIQAFRGEHGRPPVEVAAWIGPEGDFTPDEVAALCARGTVPVTLGPLVLRAETAAVYCLAVLGYELRA